MKHVYLSKAGNLWCLIDNHAILFSLQTYRFADPLASYEEQNGLSLEINKIRTLGNGTTWFITKNGWLLFADSDDCKRIVKVMEGVDDSMTTISSDEEGLTWIDTPHERYVYDGHTLSRRMHSQPCTPKTETGRQKTAEAPVIEAGDYHLTDVKGNIWYIHLGNLMRLSRYKASCQPMLLPQPMAIRCAMKDKEGRLWLADRKTGFLMLFAADSELTGNPPLSEDSEPAEMPAPQYMLADGKLSHRPAPFGATVYCMLQDSRGYYWLGTRADGLFRLQEMPAGVFHVQHYTTANSALNDQKIYDLAEDRQGRIWMGTDAGGPCCIEFDGDFTPHFIHPNNGMQGYLSGFCRKCFAILPTTSGHLLVGTAAGLYVADISGMQPGNVTFREHQREAHREQSLGSSNVGCLIETHDHHLFAATQGGGVDEILFSELTDKEMTFRHHDISNGFFTDLPRTMFCDGDSSLWVVSQEQLGELKYNEPEVPGNTFLKQMRLNFSNMKPVKLDNGRWLIGTTDGAAVIDLDNLKSIGYVPPIVVTSVEIEGENSIHAPQTADTILLAPGQHNVTLTFAALDYDNTNNISYAFGTGDTQSWTYISNGQHTITMVNLAPDTYHLQLRSTNGDGQWVDNTHEVTIIVRPTFWQTGWARLLIAVIALTLVAAIVYTILYIRSIKRKQRETMEGRTRIFPWQPPQTMHDSISKGLICVSAKNVVPLHHIL